MATWVKSTLDNSYWQIAAISQTYVAPGSNWDPNDTKFWIVAVTPEWPTGTRLKGPYDTPALAQTALDNAIANLGGSI